MRSAASTGAPVRARKAIVVALLAGVAASSCVTQRTPSPSAVAPSATSAASEIVPSAPASSPTLGPCEPASLTVRVTGWTGAAGHRIGDVELQNGASDSCVVFALARPQLVDGQGTILIDGEPPGASQAVEIAPGGILKTEVQDSNYCGPEPVQPVTVAFVFPQGLGRVVAAPDSSSSLDGVPPCLGPAGSAGTIEMQAWQR